MSAYSANPSRLWRSAEVDHHVPLFRVWSENRDLRWPKLLDFWDLPNLQVHQVAWIATKIGLPAFCAAAKWNGLVSVVKCGCNKNGACGGGKERGAS
jgi:hypothetical protein